MRILPFVVILVTLLLATSAVEGGRRKKHKSNSGESPVTTKTKTKTKWSSSTDLGSQTQNAMIATEEHGYYVKRTFLPLTASSNSSTLKSPPFFAVPIAWFPCPNADCVKLNSMAMNSNKDSLAEGYLCDDDCSGYYEPICGKTLTEIAVFYNKCKLNVAKCRSHGYWSDFPYDECKNQYPEEVIHAEKKFRANPFFHEKPIDAIKPSVVLDLPEKDIATLLPLESATEQEIVIREIDQQEAKEKQKASKDHYEKIENIQGSLI
ncbi:ecdysone-inducible gene L1 [Haematobia irritans]|uniref:ecdysone-inducible gene L1 n=1 Tax=Haematobia irritans TaxID=7368 RepID=UPI003F4F588E